MIGSLTNSTVSACTADNDSMPVPSAARDRATDATVNLVTVRPKAGRSCVYAARNASLMFRSGKPSRTVPSTSHGDPWLSDEDRALGRELYRLSLRRIVACCRDAGVPLVASRLVSNRRDFAPSVSWLDERDPIPVKDFESIGLDADHLDVPEDGSVLEPPVLGAGGGDGDPGGEKGVEEEP